MAKTSPAQLAAAKAWKKANPEKVRAYRKKYYQTGERKRRAEAGYDRQYRYGITLEQFDQMLKAQDGKCAICAKPMERVCVDHDYETKKIRGLLCWHCNSGLGKFNDNPDLLAVAVTYLRERSCN